MYKSTRGMYRSCVCAPYPLTPSNFRMCKSCYVHSHRYVQTRMSMYMPAHPPSPAVQHVQIFEYVQVVQYVHMYISASCMCVPAHPPHAPFQNAPSRPTCGNAARKLPVLYMSATSICTGQHEYVHAHPPTLSKCRGLYKAGLYTLQYMQVNRIWTSPPTRPRI